MLQVLGLLNHSLAVYTQLWCLFCVGARSYVVNVQSVDADGNSIVGGDRLDREYGVADISEPFVIPTLIPGLRYSITVSSVSVFGKVNPVSSPALIEQTGRSL